MPKLLSVKKVSEEIKFQAVHQNQSIHRKLSEKSIINSKYYIKIQHKCQTTLPQFPHPSCHKPHSRCIFVRLTDSVSKPMNNIWSQKSTEMHNYLSILINIKLNSA